MKRKIYASIIAVFLVATVVYAGKEDTAENLVAGILALQARGWNVNIKESYVIEMNRGDEVTVKTSCYGNVSYCILAVGGNDAVDVDIEIYDENFNQIDKDSSTNRLAVAQFRPRWTGTFYFKIKLYQCNAPSEYVAFLRGWRN